MKVLPVILRELRVQARQPFTYRLRLLGVLTLLVTAAWFLSQVASEKNVGGPLFAVLHASLFCATLLLTLFGAVDSLSRERREGTLGLLMLTPLSATNIVMAKVIAHGLRSLMLLVAVVPVFALPLLLGGVGGQQFLSSLALLFSAVCLALGSAAVASAWCKRRTQALAGALTLAAGSLFGLSFFLAVLLYPQLARGNSNLGFASSLDYAWLLSLAYFRGGRLGLMLPGVAGGAANWPLFLQVAVLAFVWLLAGIGVAAWRVRRVWREEPPSARREWVERKLTTPLVALRFYQRWMKRLLNRNPVGWLERRSWQGRLVMWIWLAVVTTISTSTLGNGILTRAFDSMQRLLAWLLVLSVAGTVAGSFRRERETGVLELLLVSPLSVRRIVGGRLLGLWGQFLPAVILFVLVWGYISHLLRFEGAGLGITWFLLKFATIPVIGLFFSLRCRSFVGAFLLTLLVGVALPAFFERLMDLVHWLAVGQVGRYAASLEGPWDFISLVCWLLAQGFLLALAGLAWWRTNLCLERRRFDFERAGV